MAATSFAPISRLDDRDCPDISSGNRGGGDNPVSCARADSASVNEHDNEALFALEMEKVSEEHPGITALANFDAQRTAEAIEESVQQFVDEIAALWCGKRNKYHNLFVFKHIILCSSLTLLFGVLACSLSWAIPLLFGVPFSILPVWVAAISLQLLVFSLLIVFYFISGVIFSDRLDIARITLYKKIDGHLEKELNDELKKRLISLPTNGTKQSEAFDSIVTMFSILSKWQELERIPGYLRNDWLMYRVEASLRRDTKRRLLIPLGFIVIISFIFFLFDRSSILHLEISKIFPTLEEQTVFGFEGDIVTMLNIFVFSVALVFVNYYIVFFRRRVRMTCKLNDGLSLGNLIYDIPKYVPEIDGNWQDAVADMDPAPQIASKYASILAAYIRSTQK